MNGMILDSDISKITLLLLLDYPVCLNLLAIPINQSHIRKVILALGVNILVLVWFRSLLQYTFVFRSFEK